MKKSLLALLIALGLGAALVVWSLSGSGSGEPRRAAHVQPKVAETPTSAPAAEPTPPSSADSPAPESARESVRDSDTASSREARLLADAQWVDVDLELPAGVPTDEQIELVAVGFALDRFPSEEQWHAAMSSYKQQHENGGWFGAEFKGPDVPPDELVCERTPQGRFRAPFPKDSKIGLLQVKSRYVYADGLTQIALPTEHVTITTRLGAWLTARLVLPSNLPADIDPAAIDKFSISLNGWKMSANSESHGARVDAGPQLAFEFGGLRSGMTYFLSASPPQFESFGEQNLTPQAGQHLERSYDLKPGARVSGRVIDAAGAPVADANVLAESSKRRMFDFNEGRKANTARDGTFALRGLSPGKTKFHARAKGAVDTTSDEFELVEGQAVEGLELRLGAGNTLAGRVSWPDGSAAAQVKVVAIEGGKQGGSTSDDDTQTDAEGRFAIRGLNADKVDVVASIDREREGGGHSKWRLRRKDVPVDVEVSLTLEAPHEIRGRVVDDLGAPVSAFTVKATEIVEQEDWRNPSTTSPFHADDGTFTLDLSGGKWDLSASSENHAESEVQHVALPGADGELVFTLARTAAVSGVVLDPSGAPIAGAKVAAATSEKRRNWGRNRDERDTDAEGHFHIDSVKPGAVSLTARHDNYAPSESMTIAVASGEPVADLVLTLRIGGRLEGEIYDKSGAPDAGRQIMVGKFGFSEADVGGNATSDGAGRFNVEHLAPGTFNVIAVPRMDQLTQGEGEMDQADVMASLKMTSVEIREGETSHVVLGAPPKSPVRLSGRVTQGGEPLREGMVMAIAEGKSMLDSMKIGKLDTDGRYALTLDGAGDYSFVVGERMGDDHSVEFSESVPEVEEFVLDFKVPGGAIRGRVMARDGAALENIPVSLQAEGHGSSLIVDMGREIHTDGDGRFEFRRLKAGTYTVRAGAGRFDAYRSTSLQHAVAVRSGLAVEADRALENVELRLDAPGKIAGTVRDAQGQPVEKSTVFVRDAQGRVLNPISGCVSDGLGKFEFDGAGPGTYTVSARNGKLSSRDAASVHVVANETSEVDVRLEPGTVLRVSVADENDKLIRASVRVIDDAGREVSGLYGADAMEHLFTEGFSTTEQRFGPLAPGKYKVTATGTDGTSVTKPVTLTGNDERFLRIKLKD